MALLHCLYLGLATLAIAAATARGRVHPFLALLLAATFFALASGMSVSQLGKTFGTGFGQTINTLGLLVLAAAMIAVMSERGLGMTWFAALTAAWSDRWRAAVLVLLGFLAGTSASAAASFAVLGPLRAALAGAGPAANRRGALTFGLAVSAGQAFLLPSPVVIAATAIIAADWTRVLAIGLPLGILIAAVGALMASAAVPPQAAPQASLATPTGPRRTATALVAACLTMALMLVVQSLGDIPSEPLGGGSARELILGTGRPLIVLLAGTLIMAAATGAWRGDALSETGWAAQAIARAAPLMLLLGAAGGLQSLTQTAHMAELLAERLLPLPCGLALPFLVAAVMKTVQGSSLVAAITAAGMIQPLLPALGLDGETGRALAVLAVGTGSITASHVNDGFFWLVADAASLRPARALVLVSGLTLLQGVVGIAALLAIHAAA
jgi:GntP family gluconate:H+ symporter